MTEHGISFTGVTGELLRVYDKLIGMRV